MRHLSRKLTRKEQIELVEELVVTSSEVQNILGISRARLSQLVKNKKLVPVKNSIFLRSDISQRKIEQDDLRRVYYKPRKEKDT